MANASTRKRQFNLRFIFLITTAVAIVCAAWSFADRWMTERAWQAELHRAQLRRQHDRALAEWERRRDPCSWTFGR
ncbi:MAG TPA: hypothetical protein VFI31_03150 [Pirellulales bacterium]|nr:hypothetical protein [Pirellulales bacterium]